MTLLTIRCIYIYVFIFTYAHIFGTPKNLPATFFSRRYLRCLAGWRFQRFQEFLYPIVGEMIQFDEYFSRRVANQHTLAYLSLYDFYTLSQPVLTYIPCLYTGHILSPMPCLYTPGGYGMGPLLRANVLMLLGCQDHLFSWLVYLPP